MPLELKETNIANEHNRLKNSNWRGSDQLAIYKWGLSRNSSGKWSERDLNPRPFKSGVLTTLSRSLHTCGAPPICGVCYVEHARLKFRVNNRKDKWQVGYSMDKVLHNYFIPCIEDTVVNTISAVHDGKVTHNTVDYTTAFLCSDWLYFLWHGIIVNYTIASVWCENMLGYLSSDIICSEKRTVSRERCSRKTVSLEEQIKCPRKNTRAHFRAKWRLLCLLSFKYFSQHAQFWKKNGECHSDILQFIQSRDAFSPIARERKYLMDYKSTYTMLCNYVMYTRVYLFIFYFSFLYFWERF